MFSTTFLGHQGWMVRSEEACVLVDPLLCEAFGEAHALTYRVFPPRVLTTEAFPRISAVVLSHEHDDHFDLPSLARLDRRIPIHLSSRSSTAAHTILAEMGFAVTPLVPGMATRIGDLEIVPFCGDHVTVNCGDEWDTLPFLVRHTGGAGSLFSMVDITLTPGHVEWARALTARPGLVSWTNNALDWSHMADYLRDREQATQKCFLQMGTGHKLISSTWGTPAAMITCAGGFAFEGERAWLNDRVFCVDTETVCEAMSQTYRKEKFVAGIPGQTFHMQAGKLRSIDATTPFLRTADVATWPMRGRGAIGEAPDYAPATGRHEITPDELVRLRAGLAQLAGSLVGGPLFRNLMSLLVSEVPGRKPTFAFVLRDGDARHIFAYAPTACDFMPGEHTARETYLAGLECWAADLLAVLDGELGPIALTFGRSRLWNALPQRFAFDLFGELHRVSHPLRRPAEFLKTYRRLAAACGDTIPAIFPT